MRDIMRDITEYLRERYGSWAWVGQRAHDAAGINRMMPLDMIVSCDSGLEISYYFDEAGHFSMEKRKRHRKDWSNEDLHTALTGSMGREIFARWERARRGVNVLCYRSLRRIEEYARTRPGKVRIYAVPEKLKRYFDNKILLYENTVRLSMPRIPGKVTFLTGTSFRDLRSEVGLPFVIQLPYGSSGHGTFIVRDESEYIVARARCGNRRVIARRYVKGFSMNVNAVIVSGENGPKVLCSCPSVQITGIPECSNFPASFCGNDYTAARDVERSVIRRVEACVNAAGMWMAERGYRGIFGMDLMVDKGEVYPVEINPRFQNSTGLHNSVKAAARSGKGVLFLAHAAEFLQRDDRRLREYVRSLKAEDFRRPVMGSQLIIHNRMERTVVTGGLSPGGYRPEEKKVTFVKEGAELTRGLEHGGMLITCGVPAPGMTAEPNAALCKIQARESILNGGDSRKLSKRAKKMVKEIYDRLGLEAAEKARPAEIGI